MTRVLLGTATTDDDGKATIDYISQGLGDVKIIATYDNLESNELIIHDYLYAPSFTSDNPTPTTRLDNGYQVSQRYQWFRTLMALPNTILMGAWEGCIASPTSGLGSNVQRDNNDCLTVVHRSIWDNPSTPWIHINIKKTSPTTLVVTKTGDTANNGTVIFTNCELLDTYEKMSVGATSNGGSVIGKPTFKNFRVKRIGD